MTDIQKKQASEAIDRIIQQVWQTGKPVVIVYDTDALQICREDELPDNHWGVHLWRVETGEAMEATIAQVICMDQLSRLEVTR